MWWRDEEQFVAKMAKAPPPRGSYFFWHKEYLCYGKPRFYMYVVHINRTASPEERETLINYAKVKYAHVVGG